MCLFQLQFGFRWVTAIPRVIIMCIVAFWRGADSDSDTSVSSTVAEQCRPVWLGTGHTDWQFDPPGFLWTGDFETSMYIIITSGTLRDKVRTLHRYVWMGKKRECFEMDVKNEMECSGKKSVYTIVNLCYHTLPCVSLMYNGQSFFSFISLCFGFWNTQ